MPLDQEVQDSDNDIAVFITTYDPESQPSSLKSQFTPPLVTLILMASRLWGQLQGATASALHRSLAAVQSAAPAAPVTEEVGA